MTSSPRHPEANRPAPRRRGRPPGKQHDAVVHVRLPRVALEALQQLARKCGVSVARIVRWGIAEGLSRSIKPAAELAQDENAAGLRRLAAIQWIDLCGKAELHMSPVGLKVARARAAGILPDEPKRKKKRAAPVVVAYE
jgi:hypothetical protein